MSVRAIVLDHIQAEHQRGSEEWEQLHNDGPPRLAASEIGHCARKAYLRLAGMGQTHPFDIYTQEVMEAGNVWERQTAIALAAGLGDKLHWRKDDPALQVGNERWLGHMDFLVEPCGEFPRTTVIEHKATSPTNFKYGNRLPYDFHCLQVLLYGQLLRQKTGQDPDTFLYYRSWANWAEFEVWEVSWGILWDGEINGKSASGEFEGLHLRDVMNEFEGYWDAFQGLGRMPPRYASPFEKRFACTKQVKKLVYPACLYLGVCWPALARVEGPIDLEAWDSGDVESDLNEWDFQDWATP